MSDDTNIIPATYSDLVQLAVDKIAEAVRLGPCNASLSTTEGIMVALATRDIDGWLAGSVASEAQLWDRMNRTQKAAIARYIEGAHARSPDE